MKYIKFNYEVVFVEKVDNFKNSGDWMVIMKNLILGKEEKRRVNFVMVCNGYFYELNILKFRGFDKFKGKVLYIYDYKDFCGFEGKKILIIGIGNFVVDVVFELSRYVKYVSFQILFSICYKKKLYYFIFELNF